MRQHLQNTPPSNPRTDLPVLRGSLIRLRRKCGKPNCRCATGQPHVSPALSVSDRAKTKLLTLPPDLVPPVVAALKRYRQLRLSLERQANAALKKLVRQLHQARTSARKS
jgi:hypothetical protein